MLIITIVKSSLALSLGLVGALSIVRFRAAIKEPEELAFLFLCIAIGIGLGAAQREVTIIGFLIILAIIFFKYRFSPSKEDNPNLYLNFQHAPEHKIKLEDVQDILKANCSAMRLIRFDESENSSEFIYLVNFVDFNGMNLCRKQLKELGAELTKLTAGGAVIAGAATQAKTETTSDNQQNNTISNITENK